MTKRRKAAPLPEATLPPHIVEYTNAAGSRFRQDRSLKGTPVRVPGRKGTFTLLAYEQNLRTGADWFVVSDSCGIHHVRTIKPKKGA